MIGFRAAAAGSRSHWQPRHRGSGPPTRRADRRAARSRRARCCACPSSETVRGSGFPWRSIASPSVDCASFRRERRVLQGLAPARSSVRAGPSSDQAQVRQGGVTLTHDVGRPVLDPLSCSAPRSPHLGAKGPQHPNPVSPTEPGPDLLRRSGPFFMPRRALLDHPEVGFFDPRSIARLARPRADARPGLRFLRQSCGFPEPPLRLGGLH